VRRFIRTGGPVPELDGLEDRFLLLFSGLISHDRGLDTALRALRHLHDRTPGRYALLVVGEGPARGDVEAEARLLRLENDVRFTGWIDYGRLPDVIARASIGLLPFHACLHIDASLANRLFEYMAHGLPIVATDIRPMTRVVQDTGCGIVFPSGDDEALAVAVSTLATARDVLARFALAGQASSRQLYNWDVDGARLLDVVEGVYRQSSIGPRVPGFAVGEGPLLGGASKDSSQWFQALNA
jgi:glycosyltransferase involved in cell wall biosynthesis